MGLLGGIALIAILAGAQLTANLGYDSAAAQYASAAQAATATKAQVRDQSAALVVTTEAAERILDADERVIAVSADLEADLVSAVAESGSAASSAADVVETGVPAAGTKPILFWELFGAASQLDQHRSDAERLSRDLATATDGLTDAQASVTASGLAVMSAAGAAAPAFEAAHPSARNDAVIALRNAAAEATAATSLGDPAATAYLSLQKAAAQVVATETEELAEKSGPLMDARLEIEAFARELAPGVLLDFDWSSVVNGAGYGGSMGGYTTWWWDDPGRATIELSNSVAEQWPADRSKALVAHEVGHAISVKCQDMYDSSTQDSIEKWATAWAISMGYTDDANGVWAYGYPPQEYIDAAAGCR